MKVVLLTQSSKSTYPIPIKLVLYKVTGLKKEIFNLEFLTACANLAVIFSTLGCFEEACSDFATLSERSIQYFGALLQSQSLFLFLNSMLSGYFIT